jgi:hypothetical protein
MKVFEGNFIKKSRKKRKKPLMGFETWQKNYTTMLGRSPHQGQTDLFKNLLVHQLNPQHPLSL